MVLEMVKLRLRGSANRQTGGLTHPSTGAVTQCPCRQGPGGERTGREHQALDCTSIPPLAGFRRFGNATDLRLTIRSRAAGPASVTSISSPSIGYLRSTSVWHTEVLRRYSRCVVGAGPHPLENN